MSRPLLAEHARGADLLLCESTDADVAESDDVHLSAADAGAAAADAGVGQLLLVHVDADKRAAFRGRGTREFGGPVEAGVPGLRRDALGQTGGSTGSPSAAAETASTIAAREASFERYPYTPASSAAPTTSGSR